MPLYETLDPRLIIDTARKLKNRVGERFPTRGLTQAANDLASLANVIAADARNLSEHSAALQILRAILVVGAIGSLIYVMRGILNISAERTISIFELLQGVEAGFNITVLTALGIAFILNREARQKRQKALDGLHALRSMAHVIDIHQLNKDPAAIASNLERTKSSPLRDLTPQELLRYLDYCSEMLSVIGKLAALYAQYSRDAVVIDTVNDVEQLTSSLSNKIWQKIMIINARGASRNPLPANNVQMDHA